MFVGNLAQRSWVTTQKRRGEGPSVCVGCGNGPVRQHHPRRRKTLWAAHTSFHGFPALCGGELDGRFCMAVKCRATHFAFHMGAGGGSDVRCYVGSHRSTGCARQRQRKAFVAALDDEENERCYRNKAANGDRQIDCARKCKLATPQHLDGTVSESDRLA